MTVSCVYVLMKTNLAFRLFQHNGITNNFFFYTDTPGFRRRYLVLSIIFVILLIAVVYLAVHCNPPSAGYLPDEGTVAGVTSNQVEPDNTEVPTTPTLSLTNREKIKRQKNKLRNLPPCKPMLLPVRIKDELNPYDNLLDQVIVTEVVAVQRCPVTVAFCHGSSHCGPTNSTPEEVVIQYESKNRTLHFIKKEVRKDLECSCQ